MLNNQPLRPSTPQRADRTDLEDVLAVDVSEAAEGGLEVVERLPHVALGREHDRLQPVIGETHLATRRRRQSRQPCSSDENIQHRETSTLRRKYTSALGQKYAAP